MKTHLNYSPPKWAWLPFLCCLFLIGQSALFGQCAPPSLNGIPADLALSCSDAIPSPAAVTGTNNCSGPDSTVCFKIEDAALVDTTINGVTFTFTYDSDGEPATVTISGAGIQSVTIKGGTEDVTYTGPFNDITAPINVNTNIPHAISNIVTCITINTGGCPGPVNIAFNETTTSGACAQSYTITRTWTGTDGCGNSSTASQTITVSDTDAPVLSGVPADANASCDNIPAPATVSASDNCDANPAVTYSESITAGSCANSSTITRTWTATDACGNSSSASQTITVSDTDSPVLNGVPADANASCDNVPAPATVGASDNCDANPAVTYSESITAGSCANSYMITRTWTATDACGNSSSASQTITVSDTDAPVLNGVPADANASCDNVPAPATVGASDNCDANPAVTYSESITAGSCANSYTITRTWTATDACGNSSTASQVVNVEDNTGPDGVCSSITIQLDENGNATITAEELDGGFDDNCSGSNITLSASQTDFTCADIGQNSVTLTVTDECGNASTCTATVTVEDDIPPVISCPADIVVSNDPGMCSAVVSYDVTYADNCSADLTQTDGLESGSAFPVGTTQNDFTATDGSGNSVSCSFMVTVNDEEAPVITCPADLSLDCVDNVPAADPNDAIADDNCDPNPVITVSETNNGGAGCAASPLSITRTYTATDLYGNSVSCTQSIDVALDTLSAGSCDSCDALVSAAWDCQNPNCVWVTSCKDLSNVVVRDICGVEFKFDDLNQGQTGYFCHPSGLPITTVWIKSGCFLSGDGPGYGHSIDLCAGPACGSKNGSVSQASVESFSGVAIYPNPFSVATTVQFKVETDTHVSVKVYDVNGNQIAVLMDQMANAGQLYGPEFKAANHANGIYFVELRTADGAFSTNKILLNR